MHTHVTRMFVKEAKSHDNVAIHMHIHTLTQVHLEESFQKAHETQTPIHLAFVNTALTQRNG